MLDQYINVVFCLLGIVSLKLCVGIRELVGGRKSRYTSAFSFLFPDRSDITLSSFSPKDIHRWMGCVKDCGIPILVSITGTLTRRSMSDADVLCDDHSGMEIMILLMEQ